MDVKVRRPCPGGTGNPAPIPRPPAPAAAATALDALLEALSPASVVERRPVLRLTPGHAPSAAAERLTVSRSKLAAALGSALGDDPDLLRHAADRVAARLSGAAFGSGADSPLSGITARVPILLPLPLRPLPPRAPRPGLIGVVPLAAAACGVSLAERRAELAARGWRLGIGDLDASALRFLRLTALQADVLLLRWSPDLARQGDALRGADPQALVLTRCDGADAVRWGREAGLALFSGRGAEAMLASSPPRLPRALGAVP
jgi:hypothetical protein